MHYEATENFTSDFKSISVILVVLYGLFSALSVGFIVWLAVNADIKVP